MRKRRSRRGDDSTSGLVLLPAVLAPIVLVGGWNLAASAQTDGFDSLRQSLSSLAALGASHREIMTWTFVLLGACHVGTAALLRSAAGRGRAVLAVGGIATAAVAAVPFSDERDGLAHTVVAAVAFGALALWPLLAAREDGPRVLRARTQRLAAAVLGGLVLWFVVALSVDVLVGLAERAAALAQALWPLAVAWLVREWGGGGGTPPPDEPPEVPDEPETPREPEQPEPIDVRPPHRIRASSGPRT